MYHPFTVTSSINGAIKMSNQDPVSSTDIATANRDLGMARAKNIVVTWVVPIVLLTALFMWLGSM